jgi:hypothetical protein
MIAEQKITNNQLMDRMGSQKGSDPIPPDQYLHFLTDSDPQKRLHAWVLSKTIRFGHRSPYCVDEKGKTLGLKDAAAEFGWGITHARQTWAKLQKRGLVRKDEDEKLWLCGTVPPASEIADEDDANCTVCFPEYVGEQIQQLSEDERERLLAGYERLNELKRRIQADAMALVRLRQDELSRQFFGGFNIDLKCYKKRRDSEGERIVKVLIGPLPDEFVQFAGDSVQNGKGISYKAESDLVQNGYPYRTEKTEKTEIKDSSSSFSVESPDQETEATTTTAGVLIEEQLPPLLADKGALTQKQSQEVVGTLSGLEEPLLAAQTYLDWIPQKLPKLKNIGGVLAATQEFAQQWPHQIQQRKATAAAAAAAAGVQRAAEHAAEARYQKDLAEQRELLRSGTWPGGTPLSPEDRADILRWFPELEGDGDSS